MFIREIVKQNKGYDKKFIYHALMESYRTEKGPRQRMILSLGAISIAKEQWKTLANRIEEILSNQQSLIPVDQEIESLAQHYASLLVEKRMDELEIAESPDEPQYEEVNVNSVKTKKCRTIGAEAVSLSMIEKLGLSQIFKELGLSNIQNKTAQLLIAGRMVYPASEWKTYKWGQDISAVGELLSFNVNKISHNRLYKVSDLLAAKQKEIEEKLYFNEETLFSLNDKIFLYDLTNTYFETDVGKSRIKRHGRSKEKRTDCPLVTVGLVLTESGFPKRSKVFEGSVSESKTLFTMLDQLDDGPGLSEQKKTVIIDAGIATEKNLAELKKKNYDYICVARSKPVDETPEDGFITIRNTPGKKVEVKMIKQKNETVLFCRSMGKKAKEESMKTKFQERFEADLSAVSYGLHKKGCTKKYDKVVERIGRIKQKHAKISYFYDIKIERNEDIAINITWNIKSEPKLNERFSGTYYLRTSRTDLTEKELWELYILLTDVEDSFRSMKSELGLRPNFHQLDKRIKGHIFITVLAYHIINAIQWYLHRSDIYLQWDTIRSLLSTQMRVTTQMTKKDGTKIFIRNTSEPEPSHKMLTKALSIRSKPLKNKILQF